MSERLAVIPARGGSRGIPRKNLADVAGVPLIGWTIRAALAAASIDRVVVSTDDDEIARVAAEEGAEVPFRRPPELAGDDVHSVHVVLQALARLQESEGYTPGVVAMLLPTAPLRTARHVDEAVAALQNSGATSVIGVYRLDRHLTNLRWLRDGRLVPLDRSGGYNRQRQEQEPLFAVNGAIFVARVEALLTQGSFHQADTAGYVMSPDDSVDVDAPEDLERARAVLAARHSGSA